MRVLITGATGLIGSAVCDALLARGDEVVGLTRDLEKARPKNPTVRWHAWQASTERPPPEALEQVDGVVNLIGDEINQRLTEPAKRRIRESRITSTRNLVQAIESAEARPKVFVGQSAIGYYGDRGAAIVDEESPQGEGFAAEIPAEWEAAERGAEKLVDRIVILQIKSERITDSHRLSGVREQLDRLLTLSEALLKESPQLVALSSELRLVNERLWEAEDAVRSAEATRNFGPDFVENARSIYRHNDRRAAIKREIDILFDSPLVEAKAYPAYEGAEV